MWVGNLGVLAVGLTRWEIHIDRNMSTRYMNFCVQSLELTGWDLTLRTGRYASRK